MLAQLERKTAYLQWNTHDVIFDGINGDNLGAPWGSNPSPPANWDSNSWAPFTVAGASSIGCVGAAVAIFE
jgi:hypothetical protein